MSAEKELPDCFVTEERLLTRTVARLTAETMPVVAAHFGWSVNYASGEPTLIDPERPVRAYLVGDGVSEGGSSAYVGPSERWFPVGTYTRDGEDQ